MKKDKRRGKEEVTEALLANFETEVRARRALIEQQIAYALSDCKRSCENELAALPAVVARMTVAEFASVYGFSIDAAVRGVTRQQTEELQAKDPATERLERGILASARKRKHVETPALSQGDPGSPLPSRPAKRPAAMASIAQTARPASAQDNAPAQGFVYRARPSLLANANATAMTTAPAKERQPRTNESIQAYSLNGSPLGLLDVQREDGAKAPTGEFTFTMPASIIASWRAQLSSVMMAPADRAKLEAALSNLA